jgi:hypothetical protein
MRVWRPSAEVPLARKASELMRSLNTLFAPAKELSKESANIKSNQGGKTIRSESGPFGFPNWGLDEHHLCSLSDCFSVWDQQFLFPFTRSARRSRTVKRFEHSPRHGSLRRWASELFSASS